MRAAGLVILILISVSMITLILMQQKSSGAGAVFGGGGGGGGEVYRSRRGVEKIFHYLTVILAVFYSLISFGLIFVG